MLTRLLAEGALGSLRILQNILPASTRWHESTALGFLRMQIL